MQPPWTLREVNTFWFVRISKKKYSTPILDYKHLALSWSRFLGSQSTGDLHKTYIKKSKQKMLRDDISCFKYSIITPFHYHRQQTTNDTFDRHVGDSALTQRNCTGRTLTRSWLQAWRGHVQVTAQYGTMRKNRRYRYFRRNIAKIIGDTFTDTLCCCKLYP